jgi:hypothetical protein
MFICPDCKGKVENLRCKSCGFYPQNINGILDFRTKDFRGMSIPSFKHSYFSPKLKNFCANKILDEIFK